MVKKNHRKKTKINYLSAWCLCLVLCGGFCLAEPIIVDHSCTDLSSIPSTWIDEAKSELHIVYQHTSHGSQLVTGMRALRDFPDFGQTYDWDDTGAREGAGDPTGRGLDPGWNSPESASRRPAADSNRRYPVIRQDRRSVSRPPDLPRPRAPRGRRVP